MLRAFLHFELDRSRWSEEYFLDQPDGSARLKLDRLVGLRSLLMALPCVLTHGTCEVVGVRGSRLTHRYNRTNNYQDASKIGLFGSFPRYWATSAAVAVGVGFTTTSNARRRLWLSGIPDQGQLLGVIKDRRLLSNDFTTLLGQFVTELTGASLKFSIRLLDPDLINAATPIAKIDTADNGLYRVTTTAPHGLQERQQVRILGSRGDNLSRSRGLRTVVSVTGENVLTIDRGPLPERGPLRYHGGSKIARVGYTFGRAIWQPLGGIGQLRVSVGELFFKKVPAGYVVQSKLRGGGTPPRRGRNTNRPDR